jgi:hypothetical protein
LQVVGAGLGRDWSLASQRLFADGADQARLAAEGLVDRFCGHAGLSRDHRDRRRGEPAVQEEPLRGAGHLGACLAGLLGSPR